MLKKIKIGVIGAGQFAPCFIPLFQAHPLVESVALAEIVPERRNAIASKFGISEIYDGIESLCKSDVDAVAIFTQRHLHGQHTLMALEHGKHVYCAVPMAHSLEDIQAIIEKAKETGLTYMSGETSYYCPSAIYCRDRFKRGDFGHFVHADAQYIHDMAHGFYDAYKYSGGKDWKRVAGIPPMYYPTHSFGMVFSVTGACATNVSCLGYEDRSEDGVFGKGNNMWDNPFSNETALVRTSDGGTLRINEMRRAGWSGKNSVYMSLFGTDGCFEEHGLSQLWTTLSGQLENVNELLDCSVHHMYDWDPAVSEQLRKDFTTSTSKVHPTWRLPASFKDMPNGHFGSHQFLVDDYVKAVYTGKLPPVNAWEAAAYCAPGLLAHESAMQGGEWKAVPNFGKPPAHWTTLEG